MKIEISAEDLAKSVIGRGIVKLITEKNPDNSKEDYHFKDYLEHQDIPCYFAGKDMEKGSRDEIDLTKIQVVYYKS